MGTTYAIKVIGSNIDTETLQDSITSILKDINTQMSTYIDTSTISIFNKSNLKDSLKLKSDFIHILNKSIYYNDITDGAFDVTVKPLVELWGFGVSGSQGSIPSNEHIKNALGQMGLDNIIINNNYLHKINEINIDFSAIAKGYAVDKISSYLNKINIQNHMVEIGGELKVSGLNLDGSRWLIGIQNPSEDAVSPFLNISLTDRGMATSGNYRNYYTIKGKRYAHIISPKTGRPIENTILSVTVISDNCLDSDALATALMVMDTDEGLELIEKIEDTEAFYYLENDKFLYSSGFKNFIQ